MTDETLDELYSQALELAKAEGEISVSMIQRKFTIGYNRAYRLVEIMDEKGILEPREAGRGALQRYKSNADIFKEMTKDHWKKPCGCSFDGAKQIIDCGRHGGTFA